MKTKLIIIFCALLFTSCLPDEGEGRIGFTFEIINSTNLEFENIKVTIEGLQNGEFVGTASYTLPSIWIRNNNPKVQFVAINDNKWSPNLNLIKENSEKAYFTVQLEGETPADLYEAFDSSIMLNAKITDKHIIKNNYGGPLNIDLYSNSDIRGRFFEW